MGNRNEERKIRQTGRNPAGKCEQTWNCRWQSSGYASWRRDILCTGRHGRYCTGKRHRKRQPIQIVFHVKAGNVSSSHVINGEGNCWSAWSDFQIYPVFCRVHGCYRAWGWEGGKAGYSKGLPVHDIRTCIQLWSWSCKQRYSSCIWGTG